ncbi:BglG family transcription antiterminator LicT [Oceanobacillus alkalisoli]|uniref:BglG family transcription antiterminator LicT n=1 Tax=Oceanobacillus alkalisoli TaxID=2925113 RepID=UPI001EF0A733|nr:PRD domain-containing protein [Oceanobacillus alkalisoli]MCF3942887.1 PRD domain-containing protein [Oceanobacillus alkalisoli]MCG5102382.1 PRD domain-containing protein [Oceanobacillus alkalisoli]
MKIKKILNNNVALTYNEINQEVVVMGLGLAFQKKEGDSIDPEKIEKTFILEHKGVSNKIAELLKEIPEIYLELAHQIIELAKSKLSYSLDDYLYVALIDHLSFAVERHKLGYDLKNALLWEIRKYYKEEYKIALEALDIINQELTIELPEDEAASIALHFVNSQLSGENMTKTVQVTEMVNDILNIVKYYFQMDLDEDSVNYERFLTHLRFFAMRFIRKEKLEDTYDEFLYEQIKLKYDKAYQCAERIASYIKKDYNWSISHDEILYLTLHIHRLTNRI